MENNASESETSKSVSEELERPWPYLAPLFTFISKDGKKYRFKCLEVQEFKDLIATLHSASTPCHV